MAMLYKPNTLLYLHYRQQITSEVKEHLTSMQQVDRRHYQQHPELPASDLDNGTILLQGNPTHSLLAEVSHDEAKMRVLPRRERPLLAGNPTHDR